MKPTRQNKVLGIAVGEKSMLVSEVHSGAGTPQVVKAAEFAYPEGHTLAKDGAALGAALGAFLKEQGYVARNAIFGLPAKWVLSKQKEMPALDDALLADTLRLQAEGEFSSELGELVYDYAGVGSTAGGAAGTSVLLMAVPKRYLDQITQLAEAARVRVLAVTPFSTAIVAAASKAAANGMTLVLGPSGVEFATQQAGYPRLLRYVGSSAESSTPMLMGELRRASSSAGAGGGREIFIWNDCGADETQVQSIGKSLELGVRDGRLDDLGVSAAQGVMNGRDFATSTSLAVLGVNPVAGTPDFMDSRLAAPPEKRIDRRTLAVVAVVVLLAVGTGLWYWSLRSRQVEVDRLEATNRAWDQGRTQAEATVKKIRLAQHWHGEKPKFVACLTDLTEVAPQTSDIWGTSFTLKDESTDNQAAGAPQPANKPAAKPNTMKGQLQGKATNDSVVYALAKKMKDSKKFEEVKIGQFITNDVRGGREISFSIDFTYSLPK